MSEPAILVRRMISGSQVWSMEKLENKLIDMREMYQEHKDRPLDMMVRKIKFLIPYIYLHKKIKIFSSLTVIAI